MSGRSEYRPASDGLPARVSGEWAREKLYYVQRYFTIFNVGMKNRWPRRGYVDLMAGPGQCVLETSNSEFDGSPLLALQSEPVFERAILVEAEPTLAHALTARTEEHATRRTIVTDDCNTPSAIAAIRSAVAPDMLAIAFADMLGFEVRFSTIDSVTQQRNVDLIVTFQIGDLNRNVADAIRGPEGLRLDEFFGTQAWREAVERFEHGQSSAPDLGTALAAFYGEQLKSIGYVSFEQLHHVMRNTRNAPLYRLLYASRHSRGADFFRKIAEIESTGQRNLFSGW